MSTTKPDSEYVNVTIAMPRSLVTQIDEISEEMCTSRSTVVRFALKDYAETHLPRPVGTVPGRKPANSIVRPNTTVRRTSGKIV